MLVCGALITCVLAITSYVLARRGGQDHSRSAACALVCVAVVFAVGAVAVGSFRDQYWELYGVMKPPEGAGLLAKLTLARGVSISAPFVGTVVAGYAAMRKVVWAAVAVVVLLLLDGFFVFALMFGRATGMLG